MDYSSFCSLLGTELLNLLPPQTRISQEQIRKNNGVLLDSFCIVSPGSPCSPVVYLDPLYQDLQSGVPISDIVFSVLKAIQKHPPFSEDGILRLTDPEHAKPHIAFRLISKKANKTLLTEVPWLPFLDLAIVFFIHLSSDGGGQAGALIRNSQAELLGLTSDELWKIAISNTPLLFPSVQNRLDDLLGIQSGPASVPKDSTAITEDSPSASETKKEEESQLLPQVMVLSNTAGIYGASCLLYDGILDPLCQRMDSDLLVLPSSIHEVLILPALSDIDCIGLKKIIRQINREELSREDFLSDELYFYSRKKRKLKIWTSPGGSDT